MKVNTTVAGTTETTSEFAKDPKVMILPSVQRVGKKKQGGGGESCKRKYCAECACSLVEEDMLSLCNTHTHTRGEGRDMI